MPMVHCTWACAVEEGIFRCLMLAEGMVIFFDITFPDKQPNRALCL